MSAFTVALLLFPAFLQASAMLVDEGWFHRQRGLTRWERIGHPMDTVTAAACYLWMVVIPYKHLHALPVYIGLACFSSLFITKDEWVHTKFCSARENWLHAILFVLHPMVFAAFAVLWRSGENEWLLHAQLLLTLAFLFYQTLYWSVFWKPTSLPSR